MLGHLQPAARRDEGHRGGDVQGVGAVAAGSADVDHVVVVGQGDRRAPHGARAGGDLAHGLAAQAHGGDGRGDLGRGRLTPQAGGEEGVGVLARPGSRRRPGAREAA